MIARSSTLIGNLNLSQSPNRLVVFITARSLYQRTGWKSQRETAIVWNHGV
jgi:hypothetical protein